MGRISKRSVDALEAGPKDRYLWDDELTGFALKVTPAGRKVFLVQYRPRGSNRTRRVTIGALGPITPEEARTRAKVLLGEVSSGRDPASERDRHKAEETFGAVLNRFLDEHVTKLKALTQREYRRAINLHVPERLRRFRIGEIERSHMAALHHEMRAIPISANKVLGILSKLFNWAEKHGLRAPGENPCRHIDKYPERKGERFLAPSELARLGNALLESGESTYVVAAIRLLLFTGARLNEIISARWDWVDLERGTIRLPDSKTGAKTLYLNAPSLVVLAALPRVAGNPFLIVGGKPNSHLVNLQKPWQAIRTAAGLKDVRLHDLRHTFASVGVGGGSSLAMVGALLGHSQPQTTNRYAHLAADPMRAASDAIASRIAAALMPTEGHPKITSTKQHRSG